MKKFNKKRELKPLILVQFTSLISKLKTNENDWNKRIIIYILYINYIYILYIHFI